MLKRILLSTYHCPCCLLFLSLSWIVQISFANEHVRDGVVNILYHDSIAEVTLADELTPFISVVTDSAHVRLTQTEDVPYDITYELSGFSDNGSLVLSTIQKATVAFNDLSLTNPDGIAICILNKEAVNINIKKNTENLLSGGVNGSENSCLFLKRKASFKGEGILTFNTSAAGAKAIKSKSSVLIDGGSLILNATGDIDDSDPSDLKYVAGIKAEKYIQNGGSVKLNIHGTAGRGIVADRIETNGGELTINNSAAPVILSDDVKAARGMKGLDIALYAGTITIQMTGDAGKGIVVGDGIKTSTKREFPVMTQMKQGVPQFPGRPIPGGPMAAMPVDVEDRGDMKAMNGNNPKHGGNPEEITIYTNITGSYVQGKDDGTGPVLKISTIGEPFNGSSAKAIKAICAITINNGTTTVSTITDGAEGMESKSSIDIKGGTHRFICDDDCINAAGKIVFDGGTTMCYSMNNDGVDSNAGQVGAITIGDGNIYAFTGRGAPEEGLDCDNHNYILKKGKGKAMSGQLMENSESALSTVRHLFDIFARLNTELLLESR